MKNILYIGNNLKNQISNVSSIQLLGGLLESEGYTVFYASDKQNKILRLLDMVFCFFKYINKLDYVLIDTYSTHNFYFALLISQLCRIFNKRYIPNLNGGNLPERLKQHPFLCSLIFKHAHTNVSPSSFLRQAFEHYGYDNVRYVPNTIEIDNYPFYYKTKPIISILWVRSFSKIYNPTLAVEVAKYLIDKGHKTELCMVGPNADGSLTAVKKMAKQLEVEVKFTGKLEKYEWHDLSKKYALFINTTDFDNTPVSVIEAMALGLPVVSTNVGGMPFLIEQGTTGMLVPPRNIVVMASAILKLHEDNNLSKQIALQARTYVEQFDWNTVKQRWFEILE